MSALSIDRLRADHGDLALDLVATSDAGNDAVRVAAEAEAARTLLDRLREADGGTSIELVDLTVVDHRDASPASLEVVYRLASFDPVSGLRVHARLDATEAPSIESVASLWPAADWLEREAAELFGVSFRGHPGLRPLLLGDLPPVEAGPPLSRAPGRSEGAR